MLIVQFITPLMLATAPIAIPLPADIGYDHQVQVSNQAEKLAQRTTWNGTQTYNYQGRPSDNDND